MINIFNQTCRWNSQKVHDNHDEKSVFQKHLVFFENSVCVCANAVARDQWNPLWSNEIHWDPSKCACSSHCISLYSLSGVKQNSQHTICIYRLSISSLKQFVTSHRLKTCYTCSRPASVARHSWKFMGCVPLTVLALKPPPIAALQL